MKKKHSTVEIVFLVLALIFLILKITLTQSNTYYRFIPFGLYFFSGMVVTSKIFRFYDNLTRNNRLLCIIGAVIIHAAAIGTLLFPGKNLNFFWIVGILIFSYAGQNALQKPTTDNNNV